MTNRLSVRSRAFSDSAVCYDSIAPQLRSRLTRQPAAPKRRSAGFLDITVFFPGFCSAEYSDTTPLTTTVYTHPSDEEMRERVQRLNC